MDVIFADIASLFLNMSQSTLPKDVMSGLKNSGSPKQLFAEKLKMTLGKAGPFDTQKTLSATSDQTTAKIDKRFALLFKKLGREKGVGFVAELKNIFLTFSKGDLKNVSIDSEGLAALKKMLMDAGFLEKDVTDLFSRLSEEASGNTEPSLDDLLDRLTDLPLETPLAAAPTQEHFLETSALPFLESLLNSMGIPHEKTQEILGEADKGEIGVSLDRVIDKLKSLQKTSFYTQADYRTQTGDDHFKLLFKQLGLERTKADILIPGRKNFSHSGNNPAPQRVGQEQAAVRALTLGEFVSSLENLRKSLVQPKGYANDLKNNEPHPVASEKKQDVISALFKGLQLEKQTARASLFEFSSEQINNAMKGKLLLQDNETMKNAAGTTIKDEPEKMEPLLDVKKSETAKNPHPVKEGKMVLPRRTTGNAVFVEQPQGPTPDVKTNEVPLSSPVVKAKLPSKNRSPFVIQQVKESLIRAINQGDHQLRVQLKPLELGPIVLTVDTTGKNTKVNIVAENLAAKEILTSNVNELKAVLSKSGVTLERFDVDMNSDFQQSQSDTGNPAGDSDRRNQNRDKLLFHMTKNELPVGSNGIKIKPDLPQVDSKHVLFSDLSRGSTPDIKINELWLASNGLKADSHLTQGDSGNAKLSDHPQGLIPDVKTNELPLGSIALKAKSSFKSLPPYVTKQVSKSLIRAINQGESKLRIQLKPTELGRIVMTIDNSGKNMKVSVVTENMAAKEILASNVNELKTALSNSGVTLERFDVDMNSDFKQSMSDAGNPAGNFGKRHQNRDKLLDDGMKGEETGDALRLLDGLTQNDSFHFVA